MSGEKRFVNPFIKAAQAAKAVANTPKVSSNKAQQVQNAKFSNQVNSNKPAKRTTGRGR